MANVLTDLAADIYKAADVVGHSLKGLIPSVTVNGDGSNRVAQGDTVRSHFTRNPTVNTSYTPAMTIPEGDDQTVDSKTLTINKAANVQIPWTGEDIRHVDNGAGFETIYGDQIQQAMNSMAEQVEADLWSELYKNASRAHGEAGTTPFASNFDAIAEIRRILVDNKMPNDGRASLVMNTAAGVNLRNLAQLQRVNESGSDRLLRNGELLNLQGMMLKESSQIGEHTKGTGTSYLVNSGSGLAVGTTTIPVDTGSGAIIAGDIVTFAADSDNHYVVVSALDGGSFEIAAPGLRVAIPDNNAVTVGNDYTGNVAVHQAAAELAIRPPAQPYGGDAAIDRMTVQDPFSGLVFEIAAYKGYGKAMFDITALYGVKAWKPEFIATLLG